jgi:hypothetical protein
VKRRRAISNYSLRRMRSKATAWQAESMTSFFYVYVLVSETDSSLVTQVSPAIYSSVSESTTEAVVHIR